VLLQAKEQKMQAWRDAKNKKAAGSGTKTAAPAQPVAGM
jgi:hypothetical protein